MEILRRRGESSNIKAAIYLFDDAETIVAELIERRWFSLHPRLNTHPPHGNDLLTLFDSFVISALHRPFALEDLVSTTWLTTRLYSVAQRTRASVALIGSPAYQVLRNDDASIHDAADVMTDLLELEYHYDSWMTAACSDPGANIFLGFCFIA
jgi:hypothetical protein